MAARTATALRNALSHALSPTSLPSGGCDFYTNCAACVADVSCGWYAWPAVPAPRGWRQLFSDSLFPPPLCASRHGYLRSPILGVATTRTTRAGTGSHPLETTTCVPGSLCVPRVPNPAVLAPELAIGFNASYKCAENDTQTRTL